MLKRLIIFTLFFVANSTTLAIESPFKSNHFIEQVGRSNDVATGDLNGDGFIDLFVVSQTHPHKVYFNNSETIFKPSKQSFGFARGSKIVLEDFDNDGDLDAWVGVDRSRSALDIKYDQIYLNNGEGLFVLTEQNIATLDDRLKVASLVSGDIDNDGDIDIIRATNSGNTSIYKNNGEGQFTEETQNIVFFSAALEDYDGDGYLDLWTIGVSLTIYLNDKKGVFDTSRTVVSPFGENIRHPRSITNMLVADIDGDGDLDAQGFTKHTIAYLSEPGGEYVVAPSDPLVRLPRYINNSDETFTYQDIAQSHSTGSSSNGILFDLDGDADLDLWTLGDQGRKTEIYATIDSGLLDINAKTIIDDEYFRAGVSAADFDNDGDIDVVSVGSSGKINVWLNQNTFNFIASEQDFFEQIVGTSWSFVSSDINLDGFLDFVSANSNGISLHIGDGRGNFKRTSFSDKFYFEITAADFNGDGFTDLALIGTRRNPNEIWINNQDATFSLSSQQFEVSDVYSYLSVSAADYDEDGDQDILFVKSHKSLEIWQNDGQANFSLKQTFSNKYIDAKFIDMDNDGDIEILSVMNNIYGQANYQVLEYDGQEFGLNLLFNDIDLSENNSVTWKLVTFDWDGDGDIDVMKSATLNTFTGQPRYILINEGSSGFVRQRVVLEHPYTGLRIFGAGDFNNDGLIDFYASNSLIFMNMGENNFKAILPNESMLMQKVLLADIDSDGDLDAITANQEQGMQYFINTTIDQDFTGLWYNSTQSGHGLQIDEMYIQESKQLFVSWYVFLDGKPVWLSGVGTVIGNKAKIDMIITEGPGFVPDFNTVDLVRIPWGTVTVEMLNKDSINFSWNTIVDDFSDGNMPMQRLTSIAEVGTSLSGIRSCHSGSWYNSEQSGHGIMVEVVGSIDAQRMIMTWFTYLDGEQYWILAQGDIIGDKAVLSAISGSGGHFPPDFDPDQVDFGNWGEITFELVDDKNAKINWSPTDNNFSSGQLDVSKLTFIDRYSCD